MKPQTTPSIVKAQTEFVTAMNPDEIFGCIDQQYAQVKKSWRHIGMIAKTIGCTEEAFLKWSYVGKYASSKHQSESKNFWNWIPSDHKMGLGTLCMYAQKSGYKLNFSKQVIKKSASTKSLTTTHSQKKINSSVPLIQDGRATFKAIIRDYIDVTRDDLKQKSPVKIDWADDFRQDALHTLDLFDNDDYIYIGGKCPSYPDHIKSGPIDELTPRERELREISKLDYQHKHIRTANQWKEDISSGTKPAIMYWEHMIFNPLSGQKVKNSLGIESYIAKGCVKAHDYCLVEFDDKSEDDQIGFWMAMIDKDMPVAALIHSGNKSIHALIKVQCQDYRGWVKNVENNLFRQFFVPLGADPATKNPNRLARYPGGKRCIKTEIMTYDARQRLLYLNLDAGK